MNKFSKFALLTGTSSFVPMGICSIDGEGNEGAGGGGSSGGEGQADGNADGDKGAAPESDLEKEFYDPNDTEGDDGSSHDGQYPGEDLGTSGQDEDDGDDGEGAEGGEGDESGKKGEGEAQEPPKKTGRMQERFDELTSQSRHHEREAEKWKSEAIALGYVEGADQPELPDEPDPEKYPYGEHDPDYLKDRGKYDAKVEMLQEQATARFKAQASELDAKWTKNLAEKAEAYPDFDEVVVKGAQNWACPPTIAIAIKDSDVGPDIAYQLAKDPAEALRVSKLSPLEQAREFGRKESEFKSNARIKALEAEIATLKDKGDAEGKPKAPARIVSKAPEPPRRRVSGGGARSETPADTDDFAAFERMADKKIDHASKRGI